MTAFKTSLPIQAVTRWILYKDGRIIRKPFKGDMYEVDMISHRDPTSQGLVELQAVRRGLGISKWR